MTHAEFDQLLEQVRALDPCAQWRLLLFVEGLLAIPPGSPTGDELTEEEFEQELVREGIISVPPPRTDHTSFRNYQPITIEGKPVSETIIEERG